MNENERADGSAGGAKSPSSDKLAIEERWGAEKQTMSAAVFDASDAVTREAKVLGEQARHAAAGQAEEVKEATASHMDVFADALRAAGDELAKNQSGPAAEMVSSAAEGLEGLSRSIHGKSTSQIIDIVRQFGRDNPVGFLAGSVLAGLALGRFATAAPPSSSTPHSSESTPHSPQRVEPQANAPSVRDEGINR